MRSTRPSRARGGQPCGWSGGADTALVARLVAVDAGLLVLGAVYVAWVSRLDRNVPMSFLVGRSLPARLSWVGVAVSAVFVGGLLLGTAGYGLVTSLVNIFVFFAVLLLVSAGGAALHNRALDRR